MKFHKTLTKEKWFGYTFFEQMAHIGSEVERTILWREKDQAYSRLAFFRALELLELTIADPKNRSRLKELLRVKECLVDYFLYQNQYRSSDEKWRQYFSAFTYAARKRN